MISVLVLGRGAFVRLKSQMCLGFGIKPKYPPPAQVRTEKSLWRGAASCVHGTRESYHLQENGAQLKSTTHPRKQPSVLRPRGRTNRRVSARGLSEQENQKIKTQCDYSVQLSLVMTSNVGCSPNLREGELGSTVFPGWPGGECGAKGVGDWRLGSESRN